MPALIDGDRLIKYEDAAVHFVVPQHIRYIEELAFAGSDSLVSIELPQAVDYIGNYAFRMCSCLQEITLPDNIISAGSGLFQHCWKLKSIRLPEGMEMIGGEMFESCHGLRSLTIPDSIVKIERNAFSGCRNLTEIMIDPSRIRILPASARSVAALTYMERNSVDGGSSDIDEYAWERQGNLLDLAINRRNAEAVRYMLRRGLVTEAALREYLRRSAVRDRVEITALLLEYGRSVTTEDPFEEDPFK
ncbi:MAG: leucine-rich repeat domain-containing protein [Mogibacterium sp.]|nr:leucine-rich repeat domain-containing protein [Mogibacterium sp.]